MNFNRSVGKVAAIVFGLLLIAVPFAAQFAPVAQARAAAADPAMEGIWSRTDLPIEQGRVARTWMWGPEPFYNSYEPYAQGPGGQHLVSYYDKARMEINNPAGDRNSQWFVTNGLLVVEMISGRIQIGDNQYQQASPANVVVAGDADSPNAPTYAALAGVSSIGADRRAPDRTGQAIREGLGRQGNIGSADSLASYAKYATYEPTLGHNIPDVFWNFLNQQGVVYQNGTFQNGQVVDWLFAMGYPISEPYWINIKVGTDSRWVLMQAFQRRVLTYSPFNPDGWKVEMANVGRAYYNWRYNNAPTPSMPTVTPTSVPAAQASVGINPAQGNTNTTITVSGAAFPANGAVTLSVENSDHGYRRDVKALTAGSDGRFSVQIQLPGEVATFGWVKIVARAGSINATQTYQIRLNASIDVQGSTTVFSGGSVHVTGSGFPPDAGVAVGIYWSGHSEELGGTRSDRNGNFDTTIYIGNRPNGLQFGVYATSGNVKASYPVRITVSSAQPTVELSAGSGPTGVWLTMIGRNWPAWRVINVGLRNAAGGPINWTGNATADGSGYFTTNVYVGAEYQGADVRVVGLEQVSNTQVEARYLANGQPAAPDVVVIPNNLSVGQTASVRGSRWPANAPLAIGIGHTVVEEWVANTAVNGAGYFGTSFVLGQRWQNAGQLTVFAVVQNGPVATTTIYSGSTGQRITPSGLAMQVSTFYAQGVTTIKTNASGWKSGQPVNIDVLSGDGGLVQRVGSGTVRDDGSFQFAFKAAAPWWGRTDLGVRATLGNGQVSVRYLPLTSVSNTSGQTYALAGRNWPANTRYVVTLRHDNGGDNQAAAGTVDANGNFNLNLVLSGKRSGDVLRISTPDGQYIADFVL